MGFDYTSVATNRFEMPKGWCVVLVQDVATVNEESIKSNYRHRKIEYIDIASVEKGTIKSIQELLLDDAPSRAKRIVRDNDTLIATVRPNLEHYVYIKKAKQNTIASTGFTVVTAKKVNPKFLYYYLTTKPFTSYLTQIADSHTSAYPAFNPDIIETAQLLLPPPFEQLAIATILGTLDDKIELNRRMNQTLEAMAETLFRSWFMDFEPFRDDGMQDSPLGPIPRGWRVGTVGDLADVTSGKRPLGRMTHRTEDYTVPLYGGAGPMAWVQEPLYYEPLLITGRVGTLGVVNRTTKPCWPSDNTLVVLVKFSAAYPFLCYSMKRFDFDSLNRGSTQPLVTQTDLSNVKLAVPPIEVLGNFSGVVYSIFQLQDANVEQSHTLATIRDTLLPKLLSGEIRVKDAEKFVEVKI